MSKKKNYENLDALRALCCFGIIAMHICANFNYQIHGLVYDVVIPSWTHFVILFLMLSGFSMCCGYYDRIQNNEIRIEDFYMRRIKKNLPFFSCLVVFAVIMEHSMDAVYEGFMEITMAFGLLPNNSLDVLGVSWTLGVIFLFYMLFPYFCFLIKNKRRAWMAFFVSVVINLLCSHYFFTDKFIAPMASFTHRHTFIFCTPYFLAGGLIFLYRDQITAWVQKYKVVSIIICVAAVTGYTFLPGLKESSMLLWGKVELFPLVSILAFSVLLCFFMGVKTKILDNCVFHYFGSISMEMYLAQMVVFRGLEKIGVLTLLGRGWLSFLFAFVLEISFLTVGIEAYKWIGKQFKNRKVKTA